MDIHSLLASPESKSLEFKRDLSSPKSVLKTLVAFANSEGGTLIIGRNDDGDIVGLDDFKSGVSSVRNIVVSRVLYELELLKKRKKEIFQG